MPTSIFVNLPVQDLNRSVEFFTKLGYTFNPDFTDEKATCMIIEEPSIYVMLLVEPFFKGFTSKEICDTSKSIESIIALNCESRADVDAIVQKAVDAGATTPIPPTDHGFMYEYGFADLDGHLWSYFFMDQNAVPTA